ncbi:MAG: DUF998 domain-containing protein [Candidatus Micrarchaeota archaeon]|nr:DUF998 domain-containing protein [Candidatus Micrarchaeota archaeon]
MKFDNGTVAGLLLSLGAAQFLLFLSISESLYSGYSISKNAISDLGVGNTALIFNTSIMLMGLLIIIGSYFLVKAKKSRYISILMGVVGLAAFCVGAFPETTGWPHIVAASVAFSIGGIFCVLSYKLVRLPIGYLTGALGIVTLFAVVSYLVFRQNYGLGFGGLERMMAYPLIISVLLIGARLAKEG